MFLVTAGFPGWSDHSSWTDGGSPTLVSRPSHRKWLAPTARIVSSRFVLHQEETKFKSSKNHHTNNLIVKCRLDHICQANQEYTNKKDWMYIILEYVHAYLCMIATYRSHLVRQCSTCMLQGSRIERENILDRNQFQDLKSESMISPMKLLGY